MERTTLFLAGLLFACMPFTTLAGEPPDFAREQRLHEQIVDAIMTGDPVELNDGQRDFLGVYTESVTDTSHGAALILHGRGFHPVWPEVVQPLRTALPEQGWATLSIQLPVLKKDAKYYDYTPIFAHAHGRIEAAIQYLRDAGHNKVVVIAHSCGAHMAMDYVRQHGDGKFDAYVGIGMGATDYQQPMKQPFPLAQMKVPVLDIYGGEDFPAVLRLAPQRKAMIDEAGNGKSSQMKVDGADHYYKRSEHMQVLTTQIIKWLESL